MRGVDAMRALILLFGFTVGFSDGLKLTLELHGKLNVASKTIWSSWKTKMEVQKDAWPGNAMHVAMETPGNQAKPPADIAEPVGRSFCDYCIEIMEITERCFKDPEAESEIADLFKGVICPIFSKAQILCDLWIDTYLPDIMKHLANRTSPRQFCVNSEYCPATVLASAKQPLILRPETTRKEQNFLQAAEPGHETPVVLETAVKPQGRTGDSLCTYCLLLLNAFKRAFSDRQVVEELARDSVVSCSMLTNLTVPCEHWMLNHVPDILPMLASEIEPAVWCSMALGPGCGPPVEASAPAKSAAANLLNQGMVQNVKATDGICDLCQAAVKETKVLLSDPKYRDEILQYIKDYICTIVPEDKDKCDSTVDNYGPVILQLLLLKLDPVSFCQLIDLCPKTAAFTARPGRRDFGLRPMECGLCRVSTAAVRQKLSDPSVQAAVLTFVKRSMCSVVPGERSQCGSSVDSYGPIVLQLLTSRLDPLLICPLLGACPEAAVATSGASAGSDLPAGRSDLLCKLCQAGVLFLQTRIRNDNATRVKVLANLESYCQFLPAANQSACHDFLHRNAINVALDVNPYRYCKPIFCPDQTDSLARPEGGIHALHNEGSLLRYYGNEEATVLTSHRVEEPSAHAEKTLL